MTNADLKPTDEFTAGYRFEPLGDGEPTTLSLLSSGGDYEIIEDWSGAAAGAEPKAAVLLHFDGPISPAARAAAEFASRERLRPAQAAVPGLIRSLVLWQPDTRAAVLVALGESMDALEAGGRAIEDMDLLPGEDPALLPGADRVEAFRVVEARVVEVRTTASAPK